MQSIIQISAHLHYEWLRHDGICLTNGDFGTMGLRTPEQFLNGLRDEREVYYRGARVKSVLDHPELGIAARHAAIDFELAEDPEYRDLAIHRDGDAVCSAYYRIPRHANDLLARSRLIEAGTARGATLVVLIKEIGTDALFALRRVLNRARETEGLGRLDQLITGAAKAISRLPLLRPTLKATAASGHPSSRIRTCTCAL